MSQLYSHYSRHLIDEERLRLLLDNSKNFNYFIKKD